MMNLFIVEYSKNNKICKDEFSKLYDALLFIKSAIYEITAVHSLIKNDGIKQQEMISLVDKPGEKKTGIGFDDLKQLILTGKLEKENKFFLSKGSSFEIIYKDEKLLRFPSPNDFFCFLSPNKILYNYHQFDYYPDLAKLRNEPVFIDDNFIEAGSKEDKFYQESIEEKLIKPHFEEPTVENDRHRKQEYHLTI